MSKNYFSKQSKLYASFRPVYPRALYDFIFTYVKEFGVAWDCATGNGQVARFLRKHFTQVKATDISHQQLAHAFTANNISYAVAPAEETIFPDDTFDLITVGQALHWFDLPSFYREVNRVGKTHGVIAVWGYSLPHFADKAVEDRVIDFYTNIVGNYWDPSRKLVEEHYRNLPFPFAEVPTPSFEIRVSWTREFLAGYLESWSATQKYIEETKLNPVSIFLNDLKAVWKTNEEMTVIFPLFLRLGQIG